MDGEISQTEKQFCHEVQEVVLVNNVVQRDSMADADAEDGSLGVGNGVRLTNRMESAFHLDIERSPPL